MTLLAWLYFVVIQLFGLVTDIAGAVVLAPACYMQAWTAPDTPSIKPLPLGRKVDRWRWGWLNAVWSNPEDGVSGQQAIIRIHGVSMPYMPGARPGWRAYCWSALRNSSDGMKYRLAWSEGPFYERQFALFGKTPRFKAGWQFETGVKVPVLSLREP